MLHSFGAFSLHSNGGVGIGAEGEGSGGVPQIFLYGFDIIASFQAIDGIRMPLRYNYDKPEKLRISRVFGYLARFFILFRTEKSSREVVISQGVL